MIRDGWGAGVCDGSVTQVGEGGGCEIRYLGVFMFNEIVKEHTSVGDDGRKDIFSCITFTLTYK